MTGKRKGRKRAVRLVTPEQERKWFGGLPFYLDKPKRKKRKKR